MAAPGDRVRIRSTCEYVRSTEPVVGEVHEVSGDLRGVHVHIGDFSTFMVRNPYYGWQSLPTGVVGVWVNDRDLEQAV